MTKQICLFASRYLSREARRRIARLVIWLPLGRIRFGKLRRTKPITTDYENSRELEVDRYYIESFLAKHADDIRGHVLEIKHNTYTLKYGQERVTKSDVLHKLEGNADTTIVADLSKADHIPSNTFDTIIFTQTLQFIYDIKSTVVTLYRILKPGGVVLATAAGIAQISRGDFELWGEYWRFTSISARNLFREAFPVWVGKSTPAAKKIIHESGFEYTCTSLHDVVRHGSDLHELTRFWQRDVDGDQFIHGLKLWMRQ